MKQSESNVVFMAAKDHEGNAVLVLGVPEAAWEYMRDGKTHTFDFSKAGIPVQLLMFGGKDRESILSSLKEMGEASGIDIKDRSTESFAIVPKKPH